MKAFIANDLVFYDKAGDTIDIDLVDTACLEQVHKVRITWQIQKNRWNCQVITLSADKVGHQVCPICAAARMLLQAQPLDQPDLLPVACHSYKKQLVYLTGKRIAVLF